MAKEKTNAQKSNGSHVEEGQKLTYEQLASAASGLQNRYQQALVHIKELEGQLRAFQMQDYYQRVGLLWDIIKFVYEREGVFGKDFEDKVFKEFGELMYPTENGTESNKESE